MYRLLLRPLLFLLPPELAHRVGFGALRLLCVLPGARALLRLCFGVRDPRLRTHAFGVEFPSPIGLAAGFDKDAEAVAALGALGFGYLEVGTVTPEAQPGNAKPRLFRLPRDRALLNRMGFNNHGARPMVERLMLPRPVPVGVNIGKNKHVPDDGAEADYEAVAGRVGPYADYVVVNVSSPNTPGLRSLQSVERLRPILTRVRDALDRASASPRVPLLVKIAPDLADEDVDQIADLALELGLDGIVATNTTISREGLRTPAAQLEALGAGGISGGPVAARSLAVLRRLRARVGTRLVLISVGGVFSSGDAWERIAAGATLVQVYTAFVYEGPALLRRIHDGLGVAMDREGFPSIAAVVGAHADESR